MMAGFRRTAGPAMGILLALACLAGASLAASRRPAAGAERPPPGAALGDDAIRALPPGVRRLLADAAWLAAVQHYGRRRLAAAPGFPRLRPLVLLALRFDPELRPAAVDGALLLAEPPPLGAGRPETAAGLLAAWTARRPRDWEALLVRGLVRHWHLRDPAGAARVFEAAGARPGAPDWFTALAARSWTEAGERETARSLWRALRSRAGNARARANAATHLLQIEALDRLDELALLVGEFGRDRGRLPRDWAELVGAGLLEGPPLDPAGTPFALDEAGAPRIARDSPLAGIPGR